MFNTEVQGYTIYVKGGDIAAGTWQNIFIYSEDDANGQVRLITSSRGRIDTTDQLSELVLEDAAITTFPKDPAAAKYVSENIGEVRLAIRTRRSELIGKLSTTQGSPEELGLSELSDYANSREGKDRTEAQILWLRRILLSLTPLIFCTLGSSMMLRFNRGGRGFGVLLALLSLIGYYMLAFLGEQLARTDRISVFAGGLIPVAASVAFIAWFSFSGRIGLFSGVGAALRSRLAEIGKNGRSAGRKSLFTGLTTAFVI